MGFSEITKLGCIDPSESSHMHIVLLIILLLAFPALGRMFGWVLSIVFWLILVAIVVGSGT